MKPERMKDVMRRANLTDRALAKDLNMTRNGKRHIRRMKNGSERITPRVAERVAEIEELLDAGQWWD